MTDSHHLLPLRRRPLNMNGLLGYTIRLTSDTGGTRGDILVVGGDRLPEQYTGLLLFLRRYGQVTLPSLPGFDGARSFLSLGERPSIDAFADYLAAFVRLRYKRRRFAVVGMAFGFVVATRMLQRYPALVPQVVFLVAIGGIAHAADCPVTPLQRAGIHARSLLLRLPAASRMLRPWPKTHLASGDATSPTTRHDACTLVYLERELLDLDNCRRQIPLPVWQSDTGGPKINATLADQHLRVIFNDVRSLPAICSAAPAKQLPAAFRRALQQLR